jgi:hypothetical protein
VATSPPGFARDIEPLFRDEDVDAMSFAFDLRNYEDVKANAEAIYERLDNGTMPCDGAWPRERVDLFRQWVDEGCPP